MKVLGISMGRKNERCDIYCKQVLMGVEAAAKKVGFYKKGTQRLGEAYGKSGVSRGLRSMGSLPETATRVGQLFPL